MCHLTELAEAVRRMSSTVLCRARSFALLLLPAGCDQVDILIRSSVSGGMRTIAQVSIHPSIHLPHYRNLPMARPMLICV